MAPKNSVKKETPMGSASAKAVPPAVGGPRSPALGLGAKGGVEKKKAVRGREGEGAGPERRAVVGRNLNAVTKRPVLEGMARAMAREDMEGYLGRVAEYLAGLGSEVCMDFNVDVEERVIEMMVFGLTYTTIAAAVGNKKDVPSVLPDGAFMLKSGDVGALVVELDKLLGARMFPQGGARKAVSLGIDHGLHCDPDVLEREMEAGYDRHPEKLNDIMSNSDFVDKLCVPCELVAEWGENVWAVGGGIRKEFVDYVAKFYGGIKLPKKKAVGGDVAAQLVELWRAQEAAGERWWLQKEKGDVEVKFYQMTLQV